MKHKLPIFYFLLFTIGFISNTIAQNLSLELNSSLKNQMNITEDPQGTYDIQTLGGDPWIVTYPVQETYDPNQVYVISFDYIAENGLDNLQIFYGAPLDPVNRRKDFGSLAASTDYTSFKAFMKYEVNNWDQFFERFRFDFGKSSGQHIKIKNLQVRAALPGEVVPISLDLTKTHQMNATENPDNIYNISTLPGGDPYIFSNQLTTSYDSDNTFVLSFEYVAPQGLDDLQIFYGQPISAERKIVLGSLPATSVKKRYTVFMNISAPIWNDFYDLFRFDFGKAANQNIEVSKLVLREPTNEEKSKLEIKQTVNIQLDVNSTSPDLTVTENSTGSYTLNTFDNDPWIKSQPIDVFYNIEDSYIISFEYKTSQAYNDLEIFYGPPITGTQKFSAGELPASEAWTTYTINPRLITDNFQDNEWTIFRFDFGKNEYENKILEIRNIQIRKPTPEELETEQNSDKFLSRAINNELLAYLDTEFDDSVKSVKVEKDFVKIKGAVQDSSEELFLAEIEAHQYGFNQTEFESVFPLTIEENNFSIEVPRFNAKLDHNYDRLYSRWAVVKKTGENSYALNSSAKWASDISRIAKNNQEESKASSIKGIDGLTPSTVGNFGDLTDLHIKSMKINLLLNGVFSPNPTGLSHEFNGKTYYINENFINNLDQRIKLTTDAGIKNAFVLLIPYLNNDVLHRIFDYPDAYLGNYSMANVATAEGIEYYTAMIDFLAKRYSRPDEKYGRLDEWIIHNEVDAHTSWTHAGLKPVELYTEIYDRSMRMVHYTIRKYNPTAKVFASFTKHWNSTAGAGNFKSKDILNTELKLTSKEGDYEWNIAWHSYPDNLFDPTVWDDPASGAQFNFETPQITPKNLEMIDAFVRQERVLYNGKKVRTILLSENGFNSNSASNPNASETNQAAALAYFWKKTNKHLPSIENIQLHRWVDNPNEANIHFGLWTVQPGTVDGFDEKKEGWYVWEAAGTSRENVVFDPYKSIIGINSWAEILQDVPTEVTPHKVKMNIEGCGANLDELLVSFNGELRIPQQDGSLLFYNVASNVDQPYEIKKGDIILASDILHIDEDTEINIPINYIKNVEAKGISPSEIQLSWDSDLNDINGFVIEVKEGDDVFTELERVSADQFNYTHAGVTPGTNYAYRIAAIYQDNSLSCYSEAAQVKAPFLIVDYKDGDKLKQESNKIRPHLRLQNEATETIDLGYAKIRYWFSAEEYSFLIFKSEKVGDYDKEVLSGEFVEVKPSLKGADHYLELSFIPGTEIQGNSKSGEIWTKIEKAEPSAFNELNDYSYLPIEDYQRTNKITVYWDGELVWGEEPVELAEKDQSQDSESNSKLLAVYPNPARTSTTIKWADDILENGEFTLLDYNGNSYMVDVKSTENNQLSLEFSVPVGVYILRGMINGEEIIHRMLIE